MLIFDETIVYINITAKLGSKWPQLSSLKSKQMTNFRIIPSDSAGLELRTYPSDKEDNLYPIVLLVQGILCAKFMIGTNKTVNTEVFIELFDDGFAMGQLKIYIDTPISVQEINTNINHCLGEKSLVLGDELYDYISYMKFLFGLLRNDVGIENLSSTILFEAFSVIHPITIQTCIDSDNIQGSEYEIDLYEAAIRRIPDMSEARIQLARGEQNNLSSYKGDLVYLNYHNLLVYVISGKKHIKPNLYIELVNQFKLYIANLIFMQSEVNEHLLQLNNVPQKLKVLRQESDWLDFMRLKFLRSRDEFEAAIDIAAVRVSWFNSAATNKLRIKNRQQRLFDNLTDIQMIISRRLSLLQERQLQKISTILTIFSIIIAVIGVIITV